MELIDGHAGVGRTRSGSWSIFLEAKIESNPDRVVCLDGERQEEVRFLLQNQPSEDALAQVKSLALTGQTYCCGHRWDQTKLRMFVLPLMLSPLFLPPPPQSPLEAHRVQVFVWRA